VQIEKVQLKSIKLESLNAECLLAVNRCVRHLKQQHQIALKMQDRAILMHISRASRELSDAELSGMYGDLKEKIIVSISQARDQEENTV